MSVGLTKHEGRHCNKQIGKVSATIPLAEIVICLSHITCVYLCAQGESYGETNDGQKSVLDLGAFVGDLSVEDDVSRYVF